MKHTPGPWKAFLKNGIVAVTTASGKEVIHWSGFDSSEFSTNTDEANARLIAAAPELLDALNKTRQGYRNLIELKLLPSAAYEDATREYIAVMDAAIAKAEGPA